MTKNEIPQYNSKLDLDSNHEGFEDFILSSKEYPEGAFNPNDYFTSDGFFIYHHDIEYVVPKIKQIEDYNEKIKNHVKYQKITKNVVRRTIKEGNKVITLIQCPICKRMTTRKRFKEHVNECLEKEREAENAKFKEKIDKDEE